MTKLILRPSALVFSCLAAFALASLTGCACDDKHSSESSSAMKSTDTKDMTHANSH